MNKWWLIGCGGCLGLLLIIALIGGGVAWFGMDALNKASEKSNQAIFGGSAPAGYTGLSLDTSAKAEETGSDNTANQDTAETSQPGPSGAPSAVGLYMNMVEKTMLIAMSGTMGNAEIASLITADEAALKPLIEQMMQSSKSDNARNQITAVRSTSITLNGQPYPAFEVETENSSGQLIPVLITMITHPNQKNQVLMLMSLEKGVGSIDASIFTKLKTEMDKVISTTKLHEQALSKAELAKYALETDQH